MKLGENNIEQGLFSNKNIFFNSHAGGMPVARPNGFQIDFVSDTIFGSASWFFVIILKLISTPIFEIIIHEKNYLTPEKISFSKSGFHKETYI